MNVTTSGNRWVWLAVALLVVAAVAVHGRSIGFDFVGYDDPQRVVENPEVADGLSRKAVRWAWSTTAHAPYWHPVSWLSHMLDCELYGLAPAGHHASNVIIHGANVVLVFVLLYGLTGRAWRSWIVAGLFALHPIQVGTVAWVSARPDLLTTFFSLLALTAYGRYTRARRTRDAVWVAAFMILAMLSKPIAVTLPVVMLLLDVWPLQRVELRSGYRAVGRLLLEKLPWLGLAALGAVVGVLRDKERIGGFDPGAEVPMPLRLANAVVSYVRYVGKLLWPSGFTVHYPHPDLPGGIPWEGWQVAGAGVLLAFLTAWAVISRSEFGKVGWLWYVVALFPVSGVVQVGDQAMADRYAYFPMIGLSVVAAWGGHRIVETFVRDSRGRSIWIGSLVAATLAGLAVGSWIQLGHWRDSRALFGHAIAIAPDDPIMRYNLGVTLEKDGLHGEAEKQYRRATEIKPDYAQAHNNLGNLLHRRGRVEEALSRYRRALEIRPDYVPALNNAANALRSLGRPREAIPYYEKAVRRAPGQVAARQNLAGALRQVERLDEASAHYRIVLESDPDNAEAAHGLGAVLFKMGNREEAERVLTSALARPDGDPQVVKRLQDLLEKVRGEAGVGDQPRP